MIPKTYRGGTEGAEKMSGLFLVGVSVLLCSFLDPDFSLILAHGKIIQRSIKVPISTHLARN